MVLLPSLKPMYNRCFKQFLFLILFSFTLASANSQTSIDLSRPVGGSAGEAGSNSVGAATYSIGIEVPGGVKGVQPQVSVVYSSQGAGNGYSGHGWSLAPMSAITRTGKSVFHDGVATPVNYTGSNDAFVLDGQRLMLVSGTNGAAGSVYGTEQESFSKIEAFSGNGNSPDWFKVTTKNGAILEYGSDGSAFKTNDGNNTILWLLRRVQDASGNYMLYNYSIDNTGRHYSLSSIEYTGNVNTGTQPSYKVSFTYSTKADYQSYPLYISGSSVYSARILDRIDVRKADNTQIRNYIFNYQYRHKKYFLNSVTEAGSDGTILNPITFTYGENTTAADVALTSESTYSTDRNYTGDFDGDGRTDIQSYGYTVNTNTGETWYKMYQIYDYNAGSIGGKYSYNILNNIPNTDVKVMSSDAGSNPFAINDYDGDGKEDVLLAKFNTNSYTIKGININYSRVNAGPSTTYKKVAYDDIPSSFYGQHVLWKSGGSFFATGDFDGDGRSDYILILGINGYSNAYKAFFSSPAKNIFNQEIGGFGVGVNGATGDFAANAVAESKSIIPINFDGDGKTDLLVVRNEGSYVISVYPVPASSGYNYASSLLYTTSDIKTDYKIYPGDFNGDGNTDLFVRQSKNNPNTLWKVFLSMGKSFVQSVFSPFAYTIILPGDGYSNGHMLSIGDYDGDGKSDIWHSIDLTTSSSNHVIYYSNGTSFTYETNGLNQSTNTESMYAGGDFNGDGKPDLLKIRNISQTSFGVKFLMAKPFKEQNLLVGATNLGYTTNFDYALLNNKDYNYNDTVYKRSEGQYSYNDLNDPAPYIRDYIVPAPAMYVVFKIMRPNGIGYQATEKFYYQDLVVHPTGRGFLGFKRTDLIDAAGYRNTSWSNVNVTYSMLYPDVTQKTFQDYTGAFGRSFYNVSFQQVSASSYSNRRFFMKTDRVLNINALANQGTEVLNTYDNYGNVTQSIEKAGVCRMGYVNLISVLEEATTTAAYATYAGAPYPGFPTSTTTTKTRSGQPQVSKTTTYTYTAQGLPETVTENAGTSIAVTVTNQYNAFGLPAQTTTSAPGVVTPVINYIYDPTGRFLLEKHITGGGITKKETATYDDRWQAPLSKTSTDGLTTTYQYDNFGDLTRTNFPDGNSVTTSKSWETYNGYARFSTVSQRLDGSNPVKSYIDILGREIKTEKRGFNNQWLTSTRNYDYLGRLSSESAPYYPGEPVNYTWHYYDSYSRPSSTSNTTGTITTTYSNAGGDTYTVQTTNALGQWSSKTSDGSGKIVSSSDNGVNMSFTYDSWGNQVTAGSNGQTFVTNVYDSYGRKQSTTDINAGTITYQYNSVGQLTQQTDPKGNIQTMAYDVFGRTLSTTGTQGTTSYTYYYDPATQRSNDNVTNITGFNGDVRAYAYDNLQRLQTETITAAGVSLSKTYTYDARGNLATTTYPAGFLISNVYDDNDIVTQTKYEQGGTIKTLFAATAMNSRGIYTSYNTGNGKTKEVTWDYTKETATRYYTAGVQDLNLNYEANTMNLLSRSDGIRNLTETFTYDINDRLTSAKVNGVQQFAITYDAGAQGKILQKTDVGNYNYHPNKIHQLQYLTAVDGGADPNTTIGPNVHTITYTAFLKTETITENGYQLTYTYGSDQQRLTSTLTQNGNTIEQKSYWGNMEGLVKNGNTYEIYYIAAGNGLNNIIVKQNGVINIYYAYTDQLGSINTITDEAGNIIAEQNFDAWGRKRNPNDWSCNNIPTTPDWLYRGFTGHEHVAVFALINMNGRMYDPMTGQMMAPDNYIPMPWSPGGYNRYNYANGNPLKFTDPDGEWIQFVIGAILGGYSGYQIATAKGLKGMDRFWYTLGGAAIGAASGGIGSYVGTAISTGATFGGAGIVGAAVGGAVGGAVNGGGMAALAGTNVVKGIWTGAVSGFAGGTVGAAVGGGVGAFAGGVVGSGLNAGLNGAEGEDIVKAALWGGLTSWASYQVQTEFNYIQYGKSDKPLGDLNRWGYRKISTAIGRSFAWGDEMAAWVLSNGNVSEINYGDNGSVYAPNRPRNATKYIHTHPAGEGFLQGSDVFEPHSYGDATNARYYSQFANIDNVVVGWKNIYSLDPNKSLFQRFFGSTSESMWLNYAWKSHVATFTNATHQFYRWYPNFPFKKRKR